MADYSTLHGKRFLDSHALEAPRVVRLLAMTSERLDGEAGAVKAIMRYRDASGEGEMVWALTNSILAAALFGAIDNNDPAKPVREVERWMGRLVAIHRDPAVRFGPEVVGGVRVYGSPELSAPVVVSVQVTRKRKPQQVTLHPVPMPTRTGA